MKVSHSSPFMFSCWRWQSFDKLLIVSTSSIHSSIHEAFLITLTALTISIAPFRLPPPCSAPDAIHQDQLDLIHQVLQAPFQGSWPLSCIPARRVFEVEGPKRILKFCKPALPSSHARRKAHFTWSQGLKATSWQLPLDFILPPCFISDSKLLCQV